MSRVTDLVRRELDRTTPVTSSPLMAELADYIRRGKSREVLDSVYYGLRSQSSMHQERAIAIINECVVNSGPEFASQLSDGEWVERLYRLVKETMTPNNRQLLMYRVYRWAQVYSTNGFQRLIERFTNDRTLGEEYNAIVTKELTKGSTAVAGGAGASTPKLASTFNTRSYMQGSGLSQIETFVLEAQGDLAALEFSLEHPDMNDSSNVTECRRHRSRAMQISQQYPELPTHEKQSLTKLLAQLTTALNLYAAIYNVEGLASPAEKREADEARVAELQRRRQAEENSELAATTKALNAEKGAIEALAENERRENNELRQKLEESRRSKEDIQTKYKDAKDKNKKLISLVEEYGNKLDAMEDGAKAIPPPKTVVAKPIVKAKTMKGIQVDIQELQRGLRELKEQHMSNIGREFGLQRIQIQRVMAQMVEAGGKDRRSEVKALQQLQELYKREVKLRKQYYNQIQELKGNIRVYVRVRPMSKKEESGGHRVSITCRGGEEVIIEDERKQKVLEFDNAFDGDVSQEAVFADTAPLIDSVVDGFNVCIFAYGQTGSGKTYTMSGGEGPLRGINKRALDSLFEVISQRSDQEETTVSVSVLEIYCETIRDLLVSRGAASRTQYDVKQGGPYGNYVTNLKEIQVSSPREINEILASANSFRSEGQTDMNEHSSRSHMLLYIIIKTRNKHTGLSTFGKLSLVDLAGSERLDKSGAEGQRQKEAISINKSLSALGDVIGGLSSQNKHIPFRNSTLTYLLQDSMTGQAKVLMFCCVSPASYNVSESNSSLTFASRARGTSLGMAHKNPQR